MQQLEEASEGWEPKVGGKDGGVWKNNAAKTFIVKEVYASLIKIGWEMFVPSLTKYGIYVFHQSLKACCGGWDITGFKLKIT